MIATLTRRFMQKNKPLEIAVAAARIPELEQNQRLTVDGVLVVRTYFPQSNDLVRDEVTLYDPVIARQAPRTPGQEPILLAREKDSGKVYPLPAAVRFYSDPDGSCRSAQFKRHQEAPAQDYVLRRHA